MKIKFHSVPPIILLIAITGAVVALLVATAFEAVRTDPKGKIIKIGEYSITIPETFDFYERDIDELLDNVSESEEMAMQLLFKKYDAAVFTTKERFYFGMFSRSVLNVRIVDEYNVKDGLMGSMRRAVESAGGIFFADQLSFDKKRILGNPGYVATGQCILLEKVRDCYALSFLNKETREMIMLYVVSDDISDGETVAKTLSDSNVSYPHNSPTLDSGVRSLWLGGFSLDLPMMVDTIALDYHQILAQQTEGQRDVSIQAYFDAEFIVFSLSDRSLVGVFGWLEYYVDHARSYQLKIGAQTWVSRTLINMDAKADYESLAASEIDDYSDEAVKILSACFIDTTLYYVGGISTLNRKTGRSINLSVLSTDQDKLLQILSSLRED